VRNETIKKALNLFLNLKELDEEQKNKLLDQLVAFVKSFAKLFGVIKLVFKK